MEIGKVIFAALIVAATVMSLPRLETGNSNDTEFAAPARDTIAREIRIPYDNGLPETAANQFESEAVIYELVPGAELAFVNAVGWHPAAHHTLASKSIHRGKNV